MNILLLLFPFLLSVIQANQVIIECQFPCIQSNHHCQVTSSSIQCKPTTEDTKWILKDAMSLPDYQGKLAGLGETCTKAPQPSLPNGANLSLNSSQTSIDWPLRGYDAYYGNCDSGLYCDRANVCVRKLQSGSVCDSDNQCLYGTCTQKTCQGSRTTNSDSVFNTLHIVVTIIGILLFFGVLLGVYLFRRRRNRKRQAEDELENEQAKLPTSSASSDTRNTHTRASSTTTVHSNHHTVTNMLHPNYDPHFLNQSASEPPPAQQLLHPNYTPSMQQQQLQYQLQRQLLDKKETTSSSPPPPPYSP
ncbi:hypothetical protein EDC96DRAFT_517322 [Choanephora cucurbitarum]|nr:hypothetical protein EDC96DRAFT_517322 [Choanephora cucurbitarum]